MGTRPSHKIASTQTSNHITMHVTFTSQMHIPPSMPVVQNLAHWFRPPVNTEIWLKILRGTFPCEELPLTRKWWHFRISIKAALGWDVFDPDSWLAACVCHLMLFLWTVVRSLSVVWLSEARRSRFWKRSLALMPFWAACLGTSSFPPNVRLPLAPSYTNSTG